MIGQRLTWLTCASLILVSWTMPSERLSAVEPPLPTKIEFNRDIRPILSENCYQCHGPDKNKRKADLRLDIKEGIFGAKEGAGPVIPGKVDRSELFKRITIQDKNERMPSPKSGKSLTDREITLIKKWIEQGAPWQGHWAYNKPVRSELPTIGSGRPGNAVDRYIAAKLADIGLKPSPEADKVTLVRRLHFDLLGLPPTKVEVDRFVNDKSVEAYEKLVERLLSSPHFGERLAMYWLDLVRYGDTIGYHSDNPMNVWPYRDYVIKAFNDNQRFDQFTIEQLAGDLLPNATVQQKVASCYNRLLMTTEEGGSQPKEYEAKYAADRVRNVTAVWLGSTMGCCQCHDHKFDPFSTREFYQMAAFFADVQEAAVGGREPGMLLSTEQQAAELKNLDEKIADVRKRVEAIGPKIAAAQSEWEKEQNQPKKADAKPAPGKEVPANIRAILAMEPAKRSEQQKKDIAAHYRGIAPLLQPFRAELTGLEKRKTELVNAIPKTLISMTGPPRTIRILPRGNWLDETGEIVKPEVPQRLGKLETKAPRASRLELARWLVSRDNPLTARVFTNRLWKLYFGQGLCKSLEDLGSQGEWPTHPELLDWLAVEFMESGWNVKHMVKLIVTSRAYRQSSLTSPELKERDPFNRFIARQSRFRLDAEMVRDSALAISGLLSERVGGPSVKPYQPPGYWQALNFPQREWQNDQGEKLYRRGLYTHWQRTFPHPSMVAFDAPSREECTVERPRSNIPQQALVLLNDPTYVEAARVFAEHMMREGGSSIPDRLAWAFGSALSRPPQAAEAKILTELYTSNYKQYSGDITAAQKMVSAGAHPLPIKTDSRELAAWSAVARVILNLHETMTRY